MLERRIILRSYGGLHSRPASELVRIANQFESEIFLEKDGNKVNAKSILGLLTLAAVDGSELILSADGEDEEQALAEISQFLLSLKGRR